MYKGLASLVKMDILKTGESLEDQVRTLKENYNGYDFFFFHVKKLIPMVRMGTLKTR